MVFTFGDFELDLRTEVLKKAGVRVHLARQPLKMLTLFLRRAGDLVTREDIQRELWPSGAVVDFDHSVNQYIRQLRNALGDSRETPVYIETAPRRGYRFIAPVTATAADAPISGAGPSAGAVGIAMPSGAPVSTADATAMPSAARVSGADASVAPGGTVSAPATHVGSGAARWRITIAITAAALLVVAAAAAVFYARGAAAGRGAAGGATANGSIADGSINSVVANGAGAHHPGDVSLASEARAAYLKGKYFFNQSSIEGFQKSCRYYQRALDADPSYALAYKGMADCYMALSSAALEPASVAMPKAKAMARQAIALDDSLAEGHAALGVILLNYDWDWPAAHIELKRATQLAPSSLDAHFSLALYYRVVGDVDAAARELKWAQAIDPVTAKSYFLLGWLYVFAARYADAEGELQKCIELAPGNSYAHFGLFMTYDHLGRESRAMAELQSFLAIEKETRIAAEVARTYQSAGYARARRQYLELMVAENIRRHEQPMTIAEQYALLGDPARALDYLERAYEERSNHVTHLKVHSSFDDLRNEPRFQQLLKKMRLDDAALAAN